MTLNVKGRLTPLVSPVVSAVLVGLFMYTGFSKFISLEEFTGTLYNQPIPHLLAALLAWLFPSLEILAAVSLLFTVTRRAGLFASLALLTLFTGYIAAILLHFFPRTPCTCGGIFRNLSWQQHFWVNLGLITLTTLALLNSRKKNNSPSATLFFHHKNRSS